MTIQSLRHPEYTKQSGNWKKWRSTFNGGDQFISDYLETFSSLEEDADFEARKKISYCPAFAKSAINEIKNAIFHRATDIVRDGGTQSYIDAIAGLNGGVDLQGNTMNSFIGRILLPELLSMAKVGVFIDKPLKLGVTTLAEKQSPYIYIYKAEDILNWATDVEGNFTSLLLRDTYFGQDEEFNMPKEEKRRFRHLWKDDSGVHWQYYDEEGKKLNEQIDLDIEQIPFTIFELTDSLLADAANYQIALLNLESSDISWALRSNIPIFTKQFTNRELSANRGNSGNTTSADGADGGEKQLTTGSGQGIGYSQSMERPGFIHPSPEPLKASMEKGEQLKSDIRLIVNLALSTVRAKTESGASKKIEEQGLEAGLSAIGLVLEIGERQLSKIWSGYEKSEIDINIQYPEIYSIKKIEDIETEVKALLVYAEKINSIPFKRQCAKIVTSLLIANKITAEELRNIHKELDSNNIPFLNTDSLEVDLEQGLVTRGTASVARGYPEEEAENAKEEHEERIRITALAQSSESNDNPARGTPGEGKSGKEEKKESQDPDLDPSGRKRTRGSQKGGSS